MSWRVGYLRIPAFPIAVALRDHPDAQGGPIALISESAHYAQVADCNPEAAAVGVEVGQSASRARARCPHLRCLPWEPARIADAGQTIARTMETTSPLVVPVEDEAGAWWFDARGMRWLGGEPGLLERIHAAMTALGFPQMQLGIADHAVAARAMAHHPGDGPPIVAPGGDVPFLHTLPIGALGCDAHVEVVLERLGLRTVGELAALPKGALESRFGREGRAAVARALAFDLRRPDGAPTPELPEAVLVLEEPVDRTPLLIFGLRGVLETLSARLITRGLSATRLALVFSLDDGGEAQEILEPAKPAHNPLVLFELFRDRLDRVVFDAPVIEVTVKVLTAQSAVPEQAHLDAGRFDAAELDAALNRLQGRFGEAVVMVPEARDDHRPERTGCWRPVTEAPLSPAPRLTQDRPGSADPPVAMHRALTAPEPLDVRMDGEGRPVAVRLGGRWRSAEGYGPERLSGSWWEDDYAREDWRVSCIEQMLWVSREEKGWVLRGWWD